MGQILINPLERVGGAALKEISIGKKALKTIQTVPKFQTKSDMVLFEKNLNTTPQFEAVALDLYTIPTIYPQINLTEGQVRLDDWSIAVSPIRKMLDDRILLIDPNTEWYRYNYPITKYSSIRSEIMNQRGFPQQIKEIFQEQGKDGHDRAWREMNKRNWILSFVSWHVDQYLKCGSNLIIPPAPIVDGKNQSMLDIAVRINNTARDLTIDNSDAFWSFYLPLSPDVFREDNRCKRVLETISHSAIPNMVLTLKFFRSKCIFDDSASRMRLSRFLTTLDTIKKSLNDELAIIVLDTRSEGFAYMANGVDVTCDPLGAIKDSVPFGKNKTSVSDDEEDDSQDKKYKMCGKYFHPDTREFTSINDLINMIQPSGILPHDCAACKKFHGKLTDPLVQLKGDEWNASRRLHNYTCRREEDEMLREAIRKGEEQAPRHYLAQETRGNKNLIDLLPSSSFQYTG